MTAADRTKAIVRGWTVLAAAVAITGLAGAANAYVPPDPVDLRVVDRETGQVLQVWRHHGRQFVAGRPGARYSLRVTNHTDGRVLVVLSVDGVNILTGETASYDQRGYVFSAHESYDLSGWRKSDTEIAAFAFAPLPQSYAARTGRPGDVGVIGMAVFRERIRAPIPYPEASAGRTSPPDRLRRGAPGPADTFALQRPSPAPAAPSRALPRDAETQDQSAGEVDSPRQDERLGTAHGAREWSVVTTVDFVRATPWPQSIRQIEYDTYANLVASGVIASPQYPQRRPRPFPAYPDGAGYVPDPPPEPWDSEP